MSTVPHETTFVDMIVTEGDVAPEGLAAYHHKGKYYLGIANEVSFTTTLYLIEHNRHEEKQDGSDNDGKGGKH